MQHSALAKKVRDQIEEFSGIFYPEFSKPKSRFIEEVIYGIQASKDVKLSSISRALDEEIPLKKTEERLSYQLAEGGLWQKINKIIAKQAARKIHNDTLIIIDLTDIQKEYAKKMPYLANVYDGSTGGVGKGYWICTAVACETSSRRLIPIQQVLWSAEAPDFESENIQILRIVDTVREATDGRGIYVGDRGTDRIKLYNPLLDRKLHFIMVNIP